MAGILTHEQKQLAFRLHARGWRLVDIAREISCTAPMVGLMVREGKFTVGVAMNARPPTRAATFNATRDFPEPVPAMKNTSCPSREDCARRNAERMRFTAASCVSPVLYRRGVNTRPVSASTTRQNGFPLPRAAGASRA